MNKLREILAGIRPEVDFTKSIDFFEDGLLDSFDLITLVSEIDERYGISVDGGDIIPENFCNLEAIQALLVKMGVAT
jgi:acyl carrier protein